MPIETLRPATEEEAKYFPPKKRKKGKPAKEVDTERLDQVKKIVDTIDQSETGMAIIVIADTPTEKNQHQILKETARLMSDIQYYGKEYLNRKLDTKRKTVGSKIVLFVKPRISEE